MQTVLLSPPGIQGDSMDVGQIRRLIREVFPGADVRQTTNGDEIEVEIDRIFALCRHSAVEGWTLCNKKREPASQGSPSGIEYGVLGEFGLAEDAVARLVVVMASARIQAALRKAGGR